MPLNSRTAWALEALKGIKTIQEIAKQYDVHPVQVSDWKKTMSTGLMGVFTTNTGKGTTEEFEKEREKLQSKIGQLTVEVDFLRKKSRQLGLSIALGKTHPSLLLDRIRIGLTFAVCRFT